MDELAEQESRIIISPYLTISRLPTHVVSHAAELARKLVQGQGFFQQDVIEELYQSRGGFSLFWLHWWTRWFPDWMAENTPDNHHLPQSYHNRLINLLLRLSKIKPRNKIMARLGFSHCDAHFHNLMRKGTEVVAIDFERASIGPAFLDLGIIIWNSKADNGLQHHLERSLREDLVHSFFEAVEEKVENMEDILFDLELASLHQRMLCMMYMQRVLVRKPMAVLVRTGELLMGKTEVMIGQMERAKTEEKIFNEIVTNGIYWASKPELTVEQDQFFETWN